MLLEVEFLKLPWPDWLTLLNGICLANAFMQALRQNSILTSNIADSSDEKSMSCLTSPFSSLLQICMYLRSLGFI